MPFQKRLAFTFAFLIALFVLNVSIHFWTRTQRDRTFEALRQAVARQALIGSLKVDLNALQRQASLLAEGRADSLGGGGEIARQMTAARTSARELLALTDPEAVSYTHLTLPTIYSV